MKKGHFITIEGGEGAGKSSLITLLDEHLRTLGYDVLTTREPGGIRIAEQIRGVILDKANTEMDSVTEALMYAAARRQHLVEKVIPALQSGIIVLCDRFIDSSLAYQGHARGLGIDKVYAINEFAVGEWLPDLTLYMDVPPAIGLARIRADQSREVNRLDLEQSSFHAAVREGFREVARRFPQRVVTINADQPTEAVFAEAAAALGRRLSADCGDNV